MIKGRQMCRMPVLKQRLKTVRIIYNQYTCRRSFTNLISSYLAEPFVELLRIVKTAIYGKKMKFKQNLHRIVIFILKYIAVQIYPLRLMLESESE